MRYIVCKTLALDIAITALLLGQQSGPNNDRQIEARASRHRERPAADGDGTTRHRTTLVPRHDASEKLAAAAAAATSATATLSRELLSYGVQSRVKWQRSQRSYAGEPSTLGS